MKGIAQPLLDGVKLIKKEQLLLFNVNKKVYLAIPILAFELLGLEWITIPYEGCIVIFNLSFLFLLVIMGCRVYPIMIAGIRSKNKYGIIGAIRARVQTISFEVVFSLQSLRLIIFMNSYRISNYSNMFLMCWGLLFIITILLELNRAPFDLSEGERELVRGYNVEYIRVGFVLFFLKEYGSLIYFRVIMRIVFINGNIVAIFLCFSLLLYIRSCFPRMRYDAVMRLFWYILLPITINLVFVSVMFNIA